MSNVPRFHHFDGLVGDHNFYIRCGEQTEPNYTFFFNYGDETAWYARVFPEGVIFGDEPMLQSPPYQNVDDAYDWADNTIATLKS